LLHNYRFIPETMKYKTFRLTFLICILTAGSAAGQDGLYTFSLQGLGGYTTPDVVPFWLRANQYGSVPLDGASLSLTGSARKEYDSGKGKLFDWGASFEGRANLGQGSNVTLIEGYGKVRLGIFELRGGRSKKITGLCDTTLTSGSWAVSGTSLGVPEVELSIKDFWILPWFDQFFAFKGNYTHGWLGEVPKDRPGETGIFYQRTYLHQKSLYGRLGKPAWAIKLYGGFNHQVLWGSEKEYYAGPYYNDDYLLTNLSTYFYVITGKRLTNGNIQQVRLGNHLGSIDLGFEYAFKGGRLLIYRQNLYESGSLIRLANIRDGLNGMSFTSMKKNHNTLHLKKITIEFLYTKNQAGEVWSPSTPSPYEGYYNHGQYYEGWSYNRVGLGTALIGTRSTLRNDLPAYPGEFFINNRLYAFHTGVIGQIKDIHFMVKTTVSKNFGTYTTTDEEQSTNIDNPGAYGIFGEQNQLSTYVEIKRRLHNGVNLGLIGALDYGTLLYNSMGIFLNFTYSFKK